MAKEAYYFSHDSNARNDEKILALRMKHGAEGYGVYFMIIERLRESTNYTSVKNYNILAFDLRVSASLVKSVIEDFGLFEAQEKDFFSSRLKRSMIQMDASRINGIRGSLIKHGHITKKISDEISDEYILLIHNEIKNSGKLNLRGLPRGLQNSLSHMKEKEKKYNNIHSAPEAEKEEPEPEKKGDEFDEKRFLEEWKKGREFYDKVPTNITQLKFNTKSKFKDLKKLYGEEEFRQAIAGLFYQYTFPQTRVQPDHFMENFETYLDCWKNKIKLYPKEDKKKWKPKKDML